MIDKKKPKKSSGVMVPTWSSTTPTPKRSHGTNTAIGDYNNIQAPRTGGKAPKASGLKGATKSQVKAGKSLVRKGTGSGASKQAKRTYK
jgi:hypothetical protein